MKYMILTYATQQDYDAMAGKPTGQPAWTGADFAAMGAFMEALNKELEESGELVETRALAAPVHTRRLQLKDGVSVVTDGPYAETQDRAYRRGRARRATLRKRVQPACTPGKQLTLRPTV